MIDRNTPSDPRLRERRGDLVGLNAVLFAIVLFAAVGAVGWFVIKSVPAGTAPSPSPTAVAQRPTPSASPTPSPSPSTTPVEPTSSPSSSPSPSPTGSNPPTITAALGTTEPYMVGGQQVGTVTALSISYTDTVAKHPAPNGQRWAVVKVQYSATAELKYDAFDWEVRDRSGQRHDWAGYDPTPALGSAMTLKAGHQVTGYVSFKVPATTPVRSIILRSSDLKDLIVFQVP